MPAISARDGVLIACVLSAVAMGAAAASRPTGLAGPDVVMRSVLVAGVVLMTARARHWTWIVLGASAAALAQGQPSVVVAGWGALLVALAAAIPRRPPTGASAVVGALASVAFLRLPPSDPAWLAPTGVALAVTAVGASGYRTLRPPVRRVVRRAACGVAGFVTLALVGVVVSGLRGQGVVREGVAHARAGLMAAAAGDSVQAGVQLHRARGVLASADGTLNAWYTQPARLVPVLSQQTRAVGQLTSIAHRLTVVAAGVSDRLDTRSVGLDGGRIDIPAIERLETPLAELTESLSSAEAGADAIEADWVVSPIRQRHDEVRSELRGAHRNVRAARDLVTVAPRLLGAQGPRRYFVAFTTPAEARGLGGFMGNFAVLTADEGRLQLTRSDRTQVLERKPGDPPRHLVAPRDYVERYGATNPQDVLRDITQSPDFPSVAQAIASVYPQAQGGEPIDGVIAADPYAIAAFLRLTGPIRVDGLPETLSADNAADILLRRQYETFQHDNDQRIDFLGTAARTAFDALLQLRQIDPAHWMTTLGPLVEQRRLLATSAHEDERGTFRDLGLDGAFPAVDHGDFFALTTTNFGNNKIDTFLHRSVSYQADWDPGSGLIKAKATVTLRNDAPSSGLPAYMIRNRPSAAQPDGTNWLAMDFYSPHQLKSAAVTGAGGQRPLPMAREREFHRNVYRGYVAIPSRESVTIEFELVGTLAPSLRYAIRWYQQPTVNPDVVTIRFDEKILTESSGQDGHLAFAGQREEP
jgi:hypothetical protein